jgi:hypothetical protein
MPGSGVLWDYYREGWVPHAYQGLRRVVGAFGREGRWAHVKVGLTCNPERRWREDYSKRGWHALAPVYFTRSLRNARRMEALLITYSWESSSAAFELHNFRNGGAGPSNEADEFYVYLALARPYARLRTK